MILTIKNFLTKYKIFFEVFSYTVVGIMAIIISTLQLMNSYEETNLHQIELKPLIKVKFNLTSLYSPEVKDTEILKITNEGSVLMDFNYKLFTFYKIESYDKNKYNNQILWLPINDYFFAHSKTDNYDGDIFEAYTPNNNSEYFRLYKDCIKASNINYSIFLEKVTLIQLNFNDKTGKKYEQYYFNTKQVEKNVFDEIVNAGKKYNKNYYIQDIKIEDIKELLSLK